MPITKFDIYGGIDGTGPSDNTEYRNEFKNSFVHQHYKTWSGTRALYERGPTLTGRETASKGLTMANHLRDAWKKNTTDGRIFLAGYSRGGAAIVLTARILRSYQIPVHCLMLYDAVDRTHTIGNTSIPNNVKYAFHVMRDPKSGSRVEFGNCSHKTEEAGVKYEYTHFFCTHGGIGGAPWPRGDNAWDDYISEADTSFSMRAGLTAAQVLLPLPWQLGYDQWSETNVTYQQEATGSKYAGAWMLQQLNKVA